MNYYKATKKALDKASAIRDKRMKAENDKAGYEMCIREMICPKCAGYLIESEDEGCRIGKCKRCNEMYIA